LATSPISSEDRKAKLWTFVALGAILALVALIRLRLATSPLERDEGEYAYIGQLMLQGIPPYKEAANMKFPGTYAAYAVIEAVFGQTVEGIHYGLLIVNAATILLMYNLGKRFLNDRLLAVMAATIYAVATLSYSFLGQAAHATHFVVFFGLAGLAVLFHALQKSKNVWFAIAGLLTGCAYMAKQSGFFFVPFGCFLIYSTEEWQLRSLSALRGSVFFLLGAFTPFAVTVYVLNQLDCLDAFVFWTFRYASTYGTSASRAPVVLAGQLEWIRSHGWGGCALVVATPALVPALSRALQLPKNRHSQLIAFTLLSMAAVSLGLVFRNHYWIQILPVVALLCALTIKCIASEGSRIFGAQRWINPASIFLCFLLCGSIVIRESRNLFQDKPVNIIRREYSGNSFVEAPIIADYIERHSTPSDKIFVLGSEPEIYFYSKRHSCSTYIYLFSLFDDQPYAAYMQQSLVSEVEKGLPRFFIVAHQPYFSPEIESRHPIFCWAKAFLAQNYRLISILDRTPGGNRLISGKSLLSYTSASGIYYSVWERAN
jgi:hypothetical protein